MIKEKRIASRDALQSLAIERQWFTHANNMQYDAWLAYGGTKNLTVGDLARMAEMVIMFSDPQGDIDGMTVCDVMFIIELNACKHIFTEK